MLGFTMISSGLNLQTLQDMTLRKKKNLSNKMCGLSSYLQRHLAVNTVKVSETTVFLYTLLSFWVSTSQLSAFIARAKRCNNRPLKNP